MQRGRKVDPDAHWADRARQPKDDGGKAAFKSLWRWAREEGKWERAGKPVVEAATGGYSSFVIRKRAKVGKGMHKKRKDGGEAGEHAAERGKKPATANKKQKLNRRASRPTLPDSEDDEEAMETGDEELPATSKTNNKQSGGRRASRPAAFDATIDSGHHLKTANYSREPPTSSRRRSSGCCSPLHAADRSASGARLT